MTSEMTYREAIIAGQADAMRADDRVLLMGEDIGEAGGVFKTSAGLFDEFGPLRVRDTPISETAFVGAALGMAVTGYRPIVEIMFADFLAVCFDQIVNSIAKHRFMSGGKVSVPLVIRAACGGGVQFAAQHSQTAESWLMPFPGIKVALPATAEDAYAMTRAAIQDDNPVLILEHKALMGKKGEVAQDVQGKFELGGPRVVREGGHVTVAASLAMLDVALKAAETLADDGIEVEVIDMRVLRPFDRSSIISSVKKTNRLVTVEEQHAVGGWGAEVIAAVFEDAMDFMDAHPVRVTLPDHPLPFSQKLEAAALPKPAQVIQAVRSLL